MTFNPNLPFKCINGVNINLTSSEIAEIQSQQADYEAQLSNIRIKQQIMALEAKQTLRRMREALSDPTWLNALNTQIAILRSQLT